jgi:2-C-methyl-D-erythritol 4-phosphate cytidylyltransferase
MAGGIGNRLKANVIKPLLPIKGKALFTYALDVFTNNKNINKVIIVINNKYVNSFNKILKKYKKVDICFGGTNRQDSLVNGMAHLKNKFDLKPNDIIVTHDCARINIDNKIINDNINVCQKAGFASTVLPISDSICEITNGCKYIDRQNKYLVQTPQTFQCKY